MLEAIHIRDLRGITIGRLDGLAPLTILVGPNGSGKSTVLDAMLIGTDAKKGESIVTAVHRRHGLEGGARWLLARSANAVRGAMIWTVADGRSQCTIVRPTHGTSFFHWRGAAELGADPNLSVSVNAPATLAFDGRDQGMIHDPGLLDPVLPKGTELLDSFVPFDGPRVTRLYTEMLERNEYEAAETLLQEVSPSTKTPLRIDMGADRDNRAILMVRTTSGAIPLAMAGDGLKMFARLAMTLRLANTSLLLLEEPEAHLHPRTLVALATRIRDAVSGGLQVVLTTHSLELVDLLAAHWARPGRPEQELCAFRLALDAGTLHTTRFGHDELGTARFQDGDDIR